MLPEVKGLSRIQNLGLLKAASKILCVVWSVFTQHPESSHE